jgi:hypothetical protein
MWLWQAEVWREQRVLSSGGSWLHSHTWPGEAGGHTQGPHSRPSFRAEVAHPPGFPEKHRCISTRKCLWKAKKQRPDTQLHKTNKCLVLTAACLYSCSHAWASLLSTRLPTVTVRGENSYIKRDRGDQRPPGILSKSDLRIPFLSRLLGPTIFY